MTHVSVSPANGNGPTQGQRKTLTRVGIEPTTFGSYFSLNSELPQLTELFPFHLIKYNFAMERGMGTTQTIESPYRCDANITCTCKSCKNDCMSRKNGIFSIWDTSRKREGVIKILQRVNSVSKLRNSFQILFTHAI